VAYHDETRANWGALIHVDRIVAITQGLTAPGSPAFENATLASALHCAIGVWFDLKLSNPNW
jgi:hypothetical protein